MRVRKVSEAIDYSRCYHAGLYFCLPTALYFVASTLTSGRTADRAARFFTGIFLVCVSLVAIALYLQHMKNLDPCPWCVAQRVAFLAIGLVALAAALIRPSAGAITMFAALATLLAVAGMAAAGYHLYIQADPARAQACVGSVVEKLIDWSRIGRWVPPVFMYDGPCTLKPWSLLGLSIPAWSLVSFAVLGVAAVMTPIYARRR